MRGSPDERGGKRAGLGDSRRTESRESDRGGVASGPNHRAGERQAENAGASGSSRTSAGKSGVSETVAAPRESLIDPYVSGVRVLQEQSSPVS